VHREYHRWWSPRLQRNMDLLVFGHSGARVLVFPSSMGKFYEWEDRGMLDAIGDMVSLGWFQLYCVDSVDSESWYCDWAHPGGRAWRHVQYESYILNEVLPLSRAKNPNPFLISTGASFGAYHALNIALRHPYLFDRALGMSGIYDIRRWCDGYYNDTIYYNNPVDFVKGAHDPLQLALMKHVDIILTVGRDDPNIGGNHHFSNILWEKGIWHALRVWDGWAHDWPWWRAQLRMYLGGLNGN
jgi:esterase/lipase superfamily enzyme